MQSKSNLLGLHILLTLQSKISSKLTCHLSFKEFVDALLQKYTLDKVGESSFIFDNGSFTSAFCLMESHICIHTWPEINQLTADVYLCNYSNDNTQKVRGIANEIIEYFEADVIKKIEVER